MATAADLARLCAADYAGTLPVLHRMDIAAAWPTALAAAPKPA